MQPDITLTGARARPLRLDIHPAWALLFPLLAIPLALYYLPEAYPAGNALWYWGVALVAGFGALLSALAHEGGHLLAARLVALPLARVTLYPFGGVPRFAASAPSRRAILFFALGGPLASVLTAGLLAALWLATGEAPVLWLALYNLALGLLNLLPAQPLDGVRLFNAVAPTAGGDDVYQGNDDFRSRITYWLGQGVGLVLIWCGGITLLLGTQPADGLLLIFFGALIQWANVDYHPEEEGPSSARADAGVAARKGVALGAPAERGRSERGGGGPLRQAPHSETGARAR